jgi:EmrB/QacA subfamily drug resistance transporter
LIVSSQTLTRSSAANRMRTSHPGLALAAILTCQLMVVLDGTIVNIALPSIRNSLNFSTANLSWVLNAYTLAFGGLLLLGARTGDILGRRTTLVLGITLFTAASMLGGFAQNPTELLAARVVQGIGGAFSSPAALALLMSMFTDGRERTRAIGLYAAVSIGGSAVGLLAGGLLVQWVSWRWVFFVNVPIGAFVVIVARIMLPETDRTRAPFDFTGALTSTVGMASLVYGFVRAASAGWHDTETIVAFVAGVVLLCAFVLTERRATAPITPLNLFADRNRVATYLARLLLVAGMFGMFFFLTQFLQLVLHYSPIKTGVAFLPISIALFAASQASSRYLVERFGDKRLMVVGISMSTVGVALLTQISASSSYAAIVPALALFGVGNGLAMVPLTTLSLSNVKPSEAGAASGLVNVAQQVGGSLGLAILVTVFGSASRHASGGAGASAGGTVGGIAQHAYVVGVQRAFDVSTIFLIGVLGLVAFAVRTPPRAGRPPIEAGAVDGLAAAESITAAV